MTHRRESHPGVGAKRVQLRRTKGWRMPLNTVKVDRTTKWGNPFHTAEMFEIWLLGSHGFDPSGAYQLVSKHTEMIWSLPELRGKNLACWCAEGKPCHADVLLRAVKEAS